MFLSARSAESFALSASQKVISVELAQRLKKMTGFRNIITHEYQNLNMEIVRTVMQKGLDDLIEFGDKILAFNSN